MRRLLAAALLCVGCVDYLDSGELGVPRYFGEVKGAAPLRLFPPVADRAGNAYVLYGAPALAEAAAYVGHAGGGWSSDCTLHKSDSRGAHGWVGWSEDHAWYWSGDGLVDVKGEDGSCTAVLDRDPSSSASLRFLGVVPWVKETPSHRSLVAVIESLTDPRPFLVRVDLDLKRYTQLAILGSDDANSMVVLGVGGNKEQGVILAKYNVGTATRVDAFFVDAEANVTATASISGADALGEDAVLGFLQIDDSGLVAGLLSTGEAIVFSRSGGLVRPVGGMTPAGVHAWDGRLWLVGQNGGEPVVAQVLPSGFGPVQPWGASRAFADKLVGELRVLDDRLDPRRYTAWANPVSAVGPMPFVSPHPLHPYAQDTTLWLIAGPSYYVGLEPHTSVALVPSGVTYP